MGNLYVRIEELKEQCEYWGFNFKEYVKSFRRQYPDIEIIGGEEIDRLQEGQ